MNWTHSRSCHEDNFHEVVVTVTVTECCCYLSLLLLLASVDMSPHCAVSTEYLPSIYPVSTRYLHGRYIYSAPAPAQQLTAPTPGRAHTLTIVTLLPIVHSALCEDPNNNVLQCIAAYNTIHVLNIPYTS